ncbi:hypothetical protein [Paenibacillus sabinae]
MLMITMSHIVYGLVTLSVILVMLFKRGVVIPTLIGTFLIGWIYTGSSISGFKTVFNANLTAARELFVIFLIITFMVALLGSMRDIGADRRMLQPIQKWMVNGHMAYFLLAAITFVISLFFWPTPAVPLIGALLFPAAIRAGLPPMGAAMAVALAGQGMALSSDYVMQTAPKMSATAAGVAVTSVADKALVLSLITGVIAIGGSYLMIRKSIRKKSFETADSSLVFGEAGRTQYPAQGVPAAAITSDEPAAKVLSVNASASGSVRLEDSELSAAYAEAAAAVDTLDPSMMKWSKLFAVLVPLAMFGVMAVMVVSKFSGSGGALIGGDGAAFIGGVAVMLLIICSTAFHKVKVLDSIADHLVEGFVFAFKAMGPVIPIAGFFMLGSADFSGGILSLGEGATPPAFLFDMVSAMQQYIPSSAILTAFSILLIGILTGLDGSGFSGLPLTGSLSGALAEHVNADPSTLAAIGQMGAIWAGGGTLIAWSSLVAVAGFAGVSAIDLARKNFLPVVVGLIVATVAGVLLW